MCVLLARQWEPPAGWVESSDGDDGAGSSAAAGAGVVADASSEAGGGVASGASALESRSGDASGLWVSHATDEGVVYYYNEQTGETMVSALAPVRVGVRVPVFFHVCVRARIRTLFR